MKELILAILKNIPEPHVRAAAVSIEAIVAMVRHNPAGATEASVREAIAAAEAEALQPWNRIEERAKAEVGPRDVAGYVGGEHDDY